MSQSTRSARIVWESTYRKVKIGRARFRFPVKSVIPLAPGYKFWIPIRRSILKDSSFIRPMWKPRNNPDYMRVEVVSVDEDELVLKIVQPPVRQRAVPRNRNSTD